MKFILMLCVFLSATVSAQERRHMFRIRRTFGPYIAHDDKPLFTGN